MLKYLFNAQFTNGTSFHQPEDDVSVVDARRSAFYDLLQKQKDGVVIRSFQIENEFHSYTVDLTDGHFEIDGLPFWAFPKNLSTIPETFKLIYYRQHTHNFQNGSEIGHAIRFILGWECNIAGKTYQQTIGVD